MNVYKDAQQEAGYDKGSGGDLNLTENLKWLLSVFQDGQPVTFPRIETTCDNIRFA